MSVVLVPLFPVFFALENLLVPMEGVEPTHPYGYQILSLARLPIPPHRHIYNQLLTLTMNGELDTCDRNCDSVAL